MRRTVVAVAILALLGWTGMASATWIDVDGGQPAFEDSPKGSLEAGWTLMAGYTTCPNDDTHVYEGKQSALLPIETTATGTAVWHNVSLGNEGWYEFMLYDDMATSKNVRAGLHYGAGPYQAPRLGALAVETNSSATHYVAHRRWGFQITTAARSEGWHKMSINWYPGGVSYYVDDQLCMVINDGYTHDALCEIMGSPFKNNSPAWVDSIPEPATLMLLGFGGLFLRRRRS